VRIRVIFLVLWSFQILACQREVSQAQGLCSTEPQAIRAAAALLSRQRSASEYDAGKARAVSSETKWDVWIPRVTEPGRLVMPDAALIEVNKRGCTTQWVPQY